MWCISVGRIGVLIKWPSMSVIANNSGSESLPACFSGMKCLVPVESLVWRALYVRRFGMEGRCFEATTLFYGDLIWFSANLFLSTLSRQSLLQALFLARFQVVGVTLHILKIKHAKSNTPLTWTRSTKGIDSSSRMCMRHPPAGRAWLEARRCSG